MQALLGTIVCKFGGDPAIRLREEAICEMFIDSQTDGQTDDGRRAFSLVHAWNELKNWGYP